MDSKLEQAKEWVDAEKVRALIASLNAWAEDADAERAHGRALGYRTAAENLAVLLPTPPLPTLAELIEQGNDPQQYRWVQCDDDPAYVIMQVGETVSRILLSDGNHMVRGNRTITPRPDLPKLEWPSLSVSGESEAVSVETEESECLPRPEDVPPGEPWLVRNEGCRDQWVGTRDDSGTTNYPWALAKIDGTDYALSQDVEVTLVSRLVPEHKENA